MNVVDLHVEPLLDRELRGPLTDAEQEMLDNHLAYCVECRFERQVRRDFAQALQAPAAVGDFDDLIARTLGDAPKQPNSIRLAPTPATPPALRKGLRRGLLVGALLLGSAAAAAFVSEPGARWMSSLGAGSSDAALSGFADAVRQRVRAKRVEHAQLDAAQLDPARVTSPDEPSTAGAVEAASDDRATPPALSETSSAGPESSGRIKAQSAPSLFARANKARHAGHSRDALKLYAMLDAKYPDSAEARLSKSIVARLLLDRGQAQTALESYDEVLRTNPGDVEALMGRAGALRRLGQRGAEVRTLRQVIQIQPNSPHAEAARARLEEIDR